jgi:replication factor A1
VIDVKAIPSNNTNATRYRLVISDGEHYMQAMLTTQLNDLVEGNQLAAHCVIKLSEFICNQVQPRKIVILLAVEVVQGPTGSKIGNPFNVEQAGAAPIQQQRSSNNAPSNNNMNNKPQGGKGITKVRRWNAKENLPPNWDHHPAGKETHTVEVERGTADWYRVDEAMYGRGGSWTKSTHRLVSVQRIQNQTLLKRYQTEKEIITTKRGADLVNEQYLFFGSRGTAPLVIAESSEGFMVEHGREDAFYGQGNYFALNARYSHHYAHRLGAGSEQRAASAAADGGRALRGEQGVRGRRDRPRHEEDGAAERVRQRARRSAQAIAARSWGGRQRDASGVQVVPDDA